MISGVATMGVNALVLAVGYPIYLHFLGYEQYGVWLVLSVVLNFAQLGNLGIGHAVTKLTAEEYGRDDMAGVRKYMTCAMAILAVSGTCVLAVIILFRTPIVGLFRLSNENAGTALWLLPYIGCLSVYVLMVQALNAGLSGLGRMDLANYAQTGGRFVAVVTATVLLSRGGGVKSLLIGNTASYIFIHAVSFISIRRIAKIRFLCRSNLDVGRTRRLLSFGGGVFGNSVLGMLINPFNKLMLSRYAGVETIPVYEVAFHAASLFRSVFEAAFRAIMPEISRLGSEVSIQARERIKAINLRVFKAIVFFALPSYIGMVIVAEPFLKLWLRHSYSASIPWAFRIMLASTFLSLLTVPAYYTIMGLGRVRCFITGGVVAAGVNVGLVLALRVVATEVSVDRVCACMVATSGVYLLYMVCEVRRLLSFGIPWDGNARTTAIIQVE